MGNFLRKISFIIFFLSLILGNFSVSSAEFSSLAENQNNTFSSRCWQPPQAPILNQPNNNTATNRTNIEFSWLTAVSSCSLANISYRFQLNNVNDFASPLINTPFSANLNYTYNDIPESEYWWRVQAKDQFDNISTSSVYHLIVDRTSPSASLSISGSFTKAVEEKIINGSFETGDLTGWTTAGKVDLINGNETVTNASPSSTIVVSPVEGTKMVRIGHTEGDSGNYVWENRLMGSFDAGAKSLSLNYNFFSRDYSFFD